MTEEQKYTVERKFPKFEVRRYEACVFADVAVQADFQSAGSMAFRSLIGYISGSNEPNKKIGVIDQRSLVKQYEMSAPDNN